MNADDDDHNIPSDLDLCDPLSAADYQHHTLGDTPSNDIIEFLDAMSQQHQLIGGDEERIDCEIGDQQQLGGKVGGEHQLRGEIGGEQQLGGEIVGEQQLENMKTQKKAHFVREPYLVRSRKPKESVFQTLQTEERCYNLTVSDALQLHGDSAVTALVGECNNLMQKSTFRPMHLFDMTGEERKSIIRSKTFMKEKTRTDGSFDKLKARLVAGGHQQNRSVYTKEETSSPTVATASVFTCATIAAHERRRVITMDIAAAFLNADMLPGKPVYMKLDPVMSAILGQLDANYEMYTQQDGSIIVKLEKALYGCVQSAALWYHNLRNTLEENGYICNPYDVCVFNKTVEGIQTTVLFHVDDLMASCVKDEYLTQLYNVLVAKYGKVTITSGYDHSYLGMRFLFNRDDGTVNVSMSGFIDDTIGQYGVTGESTCPAGENLFIIKESPQLNTEQSIRFHTFVAKLLYLSKRTRPDLLTLVSFLTTRVQQPTEDDDYKLTKGMKYLMKTRHLNINLGVTGEMSITAYVDASFAVHPDMRSHTGVMVTLGKGALYSRSSKQKLNTKSSTESELVALSDALPQVLWFQRFLCAQGYPELPAHIWEDNESTITLAKTGKSCSERSRHIEIRYFWIHDYLKNKTITIQHLHTDAMAADIFTKPLQGAKFLLFRQICLNHD